MNKQEIQEILTAEMILAADEGPEEFDSACACDMMSDLLAVMNRSGHFDRNVVLVTGLTNPQVIRTSEMVDIHLIVFCRGKQPSPETMALARANGITLMGTRHTMFTTCGLLYQHNLRSIFAEKRYV